MRVQPMRVSCFVAAIREWARHTWGRWWGSLKKMSAADGPEILVSE